MKKCLFIVCLLLLVLLSSCDDNSKNNAANADDIILDVIDIEKCVIKKEIDVPYDKKDVISTLTITEDYLDITEFLEDNPLEYFVNRTYRLIGDEVYYTFDASDYYKNVSGDKTIKLSEENFKEYHDNPTEIMHPTTKDEFLVFKKAFILAYLYHCPFDRVEQIYNFYYELFKGDYKIMLDEELSSIDNISKLTLSKLGSYAIDNNRINFDDSFILLNEANSVWGVSHFSEEIDSRIWINYNEGIKKEFADTLKIDQYVDKAIKDERVNWIYYYDNKVLNFLNYNYQILPSDFDYSENINMRAYIDIADEKSFKEAVCICQFKDQELTKITYEKALKNVIDDKFSFGYSNEFLFIGINYDTEKMILPEILSIEVSSKGKYSDYDNEVKQVIYFEYLYDNVFENDMHVEEIETYEEYLAIKEKVNEAFYYIDEEGKNFREGQTVDSSINSITEEAFNDKKLLAIQVYSRAHKTEGIDIYGSNITMKIDSGMNGMVYGCHFMIIEVDSNYVLDNPVFEFYESVDDLLWFTKLEGL